MWHHDYVLDEGRRNCVSVAGSSHPPVMSFPPVKEQPCSARSPARPRVAALGGALVALLLVPCHRRGRRRRRRARPPKPPKPASSLAEEHTLSNGMKLVLVPRHLSPTVAGGWVAHVGSANERPGITGISHLFEHMMFKGYARDRHPRLRQGRAAHRRAGDAPGPDARRAVEDCGPPSGAARSTT